MKRISQVMFVAALACGAQVAFAQQSGEIVESKRGSAEVYADASAIGSTGGSTHTLVARPAGLMQSYLDEMGFGTVPPFPSRGGVLDD